MFAEYAVIPLDVPPPPVSIDKLRDFVQHKCESCAFTKNVIRYVHFYGRKPIINGSIDLYPSGPQFHQATSDTLFDWDPEFHRQFPAWTDWFEALPFDEIQGLDLVTQTNDIPEHLDIFGDNNSITHFRRFSQLEPIYYRAILFEPDDDVVRHHSFYVTEAFGGEKHFVQLPRGTNIFAMSSSVCYHGSLHNAGHYKTTVAMYGILNASAHLDLLRRSLDKYRDFAIRFSPAPVGGPGALFPYPGPASVS